MNRTHILASICLLFSGNLVQAQQLRGKVFGLIGQEKEILPGSTILAVESGQKALVNENGVFELPWDTITDKRIVAIEQGFIADTIVVGDKRYLSVVLRPAARELKGIVVKDQRSAYIANSLIKTEVINQRELSKAACCDLAGCFGTQASVQPQTTNVVTNAQELRLLGVSGVYNQLLVDGLPMITGASYTYGVSTYPGTIVDNIYISKGANSVLQGYESISGQINMESVQPDKAESFYANAYANSFGEIHLNANTAGTVSRNKKWRSLLALHYVQPAAKVDGNHDGFLDLPRLRRLMLFNKWKYGEENEVGFSTQIGLRWLRESRIGGQMNYNPETDLGSTQVYGQSVSFEQPELSVKSTYRFSSKSALILNLSGFMHRQNSWFGVTRYQATQNNAYANITHEWRWHKAHSLKYGMSYRYQRLAEQIDFSNNQLNRGFAGQYQTNLDVPGLFAENTFQWLNEKIVLLSGIRVDRHQVWGNFVTPRTMLKIAPNDRHTFRASAGTGWRQVNLFSEQVNLLVGSRDVVFQETLQPEQAFTYGFNYTYRFKTPFCTGTLGLDLYGTDFKRQFFPDYDLDPRRIYVYNFTGSTQSYSAQAEASLVFFQKLEFRLAYNYLEAYRVQNGQNVLLPFNPRNRLMSALSYRIKEGKWQMDVNAHWFDKMRLPNTASLPAELKRGDFSVPYALLNVQVTRRWKSFEVYVGCENIAHYRQPNPIISAQNPFGPYFDLSSVWGPTRGRELYIGFRYKIP